MISTCALAHLCDVLRFGDVAAAVRDVLCAELGNGFRYVRIDCFVPRSLLSQGPPRVLYGDVRLEYCEGSCDPIRFYSLVDAVCRGQLSHLREGVVGSLRIDGSVEAAACDRCRLRYPTCMLLVKVRACEGTSFLGSSMAPLNCVCGDVAGAGVTKLCVRCADMVGWWEVVTGVTETRVPAVLSAKWAVATA